MAPVDETHPMGTRLGETNIAKPRSDFGLSPRLVAWLFAIILVSECAILFLQAGARPFWYDELFTFHVSGLQPLSQVLTALDAGVDTMTPAYHVLVRIARQFPGHPQLTLRLPSILGYLLSLTGVYLFVRKKLPPIVALTGVLLMSLTPFREYAIEARSYSLLVGFLAMAAAFWQRIDEKPVMALWFAISLGAAVASHHLAVVAIGPFIVAELTWSALRRSIRWKVWGGCLLGVCAFLADLPLLLHFRNTFETHFWAAPTLHTIIPAYTMYSGLDNTLIFGGIALLLIVLGRTLLRNRRNGVAEQGGENLSTPEIILIAVFLFYPVVLIVLTYILHAGFTNRYAWPGILGLVLAATLTVREIRIKGAWLAGTAALLIAFAYQSKHEYQEFRSGAKEDKDRWSVLAEVGRGEPDLPIVIASGMNYLEATEYAPRELRGRLIAVADRDTAVRMAGTDSVDNGLLLLGRFIPLRLEKLSQFQADHSRFILQAGGSYDWLTAWLMENKYNLKLAGNRPGASVYLVDR